MSRRPPGLSQMVPGAPRFMSMAWGSWKGDNGKETVEDKWEGGSQSVEVRGAVLRGHRLQAEQGEVGCHWQDLQHLCPLGAAHGPRGW